MFFVGFDISINSPSYTIFDSEQNKYYSYCYSSVFKQHSFYSTINNHTFYIEQQTGEELGFDRYMVISKHIGDTLISKIVKNKSNILLEGYSFGTSSRSVFELPEFTSLIKYQLRCNGFVFDTIPPKSWKKSVVGNGNADKIMTIDWLVGNNEAFSLFINEYITFVKSTKKGKSAEKDVNIYKSPISDIADSICICMRCVE